MENLADLYVKMERYEKGRELLLKVVEARNQAFPEGDLTTLNSMSSLAMIYERLGRYEDAERLLDAVLAGQQKRLDRYHPQVLITVMNLAEVLVGLERFEDAEQMQRNLLSIIRQRQPENALYIASILVELGMTLNCREKFVEACEAIEPIACKPGEIRDECIFCSGQTIKQCRLANIRTSYQC